MSSKSIDSQGRIVIGSLKGNIQGLGKDIVAAALRSAGFHVTDLGVNVSPEVFVESALREEAQIIAISISMNESVRYLKDVVALIHRKNLDDRVKTVVGGPAASEEICKTYGLDACTKDAADCVRKVEALLSHF